MESVDFYPVVLMFTILKMMSQGMTVFYTRCNDMLNRMVCKKNIFE